MGHINKLAKLLNGPPVSFAQTKKSYGIFGDRGSIGKRAQMETMGCVGTIFSIVNRTSNATASVNWRLYRSAASGKKEDRVEITTGHLALNIWNKPNTFYTRQEFVEAQQQHVDLAGESFWVVSYLGSTSIPDEMWVVRPDRMSPITSETEFLLGWKYKGPDGEEVPLSLEEVIQVRMPNPLDPYRGMGPVQTVMSQIGSYEDAWAYNRNFFQNGAEPGGVIQVPERLDDDQFNELRARWNESHRGVTNAHRVAILEHGEYKPNTITQRDMQFTEGLGLTREVILEAFGIPKFAIGDVGDVNRATADASKAWFSEQLTVPRLERIKGALNNDYLPLFGTSGIGVEFDYDNPVPEDADAENAARANKTSAFKTLIDAGVEPEDAASVCELPNMRMKSSSPDREAVTQ